MLLNVKILKYKHFTPLNKLVLAVIDFHEVAAMSINCHLTSQEMGDTLGLTRGQIQDELFALIELGLITSKVENRIRHSNITSRTKRLIK